MRSSVSPLSHQPCLCVTRRWRWASAAEAGACWRSPPPCCSGGTPSASRCPSRMSRSCCGASSLSPPARYATLPRWCGSRYHVLHLDLKKKNKLSFHHLFKILFSITSTFASWSYQSRRTSGKGAAGDHCGCDLTPTYALVILIMSAGQARSSHRFLAGGVGVLGEGGLQATCPVMFRPVITSDWAELAHRGASRIPSRFRLIQSSHPPF